MSLLRSKALRLFAAIGEDMVDQTEAVRTWEDPKVDVSLGTSDALYLGKDHAFNNLYIHVATPNTNGGALIAEVWNGQTWKEITSFLDETSAFTQSGFIQWPEGDENYAWQKDYTDRIPELASIGIKTILFWMRLRVSSAVSAGTEIQAIKTLLSDDRLLSTIHPEIMEYLPTGETTFLKQHELAKDAIVNHCLVKGLIQYEEQIKDPEQWMLAASYKCIELILAPIPGDERLNAVKKDMAKKASDALALSAASLDRDKNEHLDMDEVQPGRMGYLTR